MGEGGGGEGVNICLMPAYACFCLAKPKQLSQSLAEMQSEKELYTII